MSRVPGRRSRIGVDVGGTFTDLVVVTEDGIEVRKTPSTPSAPEEGVVTGLQALRGDGHAPEEFGFLGHGTTVALNAILEGAWAKTGLVTTEGFRDVLEIGRQSRPSLYDLRARKPDPVVPRDRRLEVEERLDERGRVVTPLDESDVAEVVSELDDAGVESVAVSLLFSFENDDHEERIREAIASELDVPVSLSSEVLPEIREYERTQTTALNAALTPVIADYLARLEAGLEALQVGSEPKIMQSNGGIIGTARARRRPVNTCLSGPAAGVQGAAYVARQRGVDDVVTLDMGGTSCDVSLVEGGEPLVTTETDIGDYPVHVPSVDVHTIGAGGGSIAWLDAGGALRVGPRSAGADPGPICYGNGGTEPTVTDAHLLLGRLSTEPFRTDRPAGVREEVREAFETTLAEPMDMTPEEVALGVLEVANANMERALRVVSVERGYDPRDFALVAFGGAGPLHGPVLARELDVPEVIVPPTAGVLSALGLLVSDIVYDFGVSKVRDLADIDPATIERELAGFEERAASQLADEGFTDDRMRMEPAVDLRYVGQSFELTVPVEAGDLDDPDFERLRRRFHEHHRKTYGHASPDEAVELVTIRTRAVGSVDPPTLSERRVEGVLADTERERREVGFSEGTHGTPVYERAALPDSAVIEGPAIVEDVGSTVVVHPGQEASVDEGRNLVVEVDP